MRVQSAIRVAFLALVAAAFADAQCPQVTLKASAPRRLSYGKKFRVKATVLNTGGSVQGLYLAIQLPNGLGYAKTSKSLPNEPVVWGANAQNLYWPLPALNKKFASFQVNLNVTGCFSAAQTAALPVSIFQLDGQGNQKCVQSKSLQTQIKQANSKKCTAPVTCTTTQGWYTIAPFGQTVGSSIFGAYLSADGVTPVYGTVPIADTTSPSAPGITLNPAYSSTLRATRLVTQMPDTVTLFPMSNGKLYLLTNVEDYPATIYMSEVAQAADGKLTLTSTRGLASPLGNAGPFAFLCAGSITPWGDRLTGEEYTYDARSTSLYSSSTVKSLGRAAGWYSGTPGEALPNPPNRGSVDYPGNKSVADSEFRPYNYGSIVESKVALDGTVTTRKLWTMGRLNHELAVVLPDRKTVITTDDVSANGAIVMFVADQAGDLTSGELFAPRFRNQAGPTNTATGAGAEWDVEWISLARATQAELDTIRSTLTFSSIFDTATCTVTSNVPSCPSGFTRIANPSYVVSNIYCECLKLKPGMEKAAAFFETRRYAAYVGATVEFAKGEGITYSEELKKVYIALTRFRFGARDGATTTIPYQYDIQGHDDIRLPENTCGGILELDVANGWRPVHARMMLAGMPQAADAQLNTCDVNNIASPDNILVLPGTSTMLILEDCDDHFNCAIWSLDLLQKAPYQQTWPANPTLTRIGSAPPDAEATGAWYTSVGGFTYITMGFQRSNPAVVGYLGPVPTSLTAPRQGFTPNTVGALRRWVFDGIPSQTGTPGQGIPVASSRLCIV